MPYILMGYPDPMIDWSTDAVCTSDSPNEAALSVEGGCGSMKELLDCQGTNNSVAVSGVFVQTGPAAHLVNPLLDSRY